MPGIWLGARADRSIVVINLKKIFIHQEYVHEPCQSTSFNDLERKRRIAADSQLGCRYLQARGIGLNYSDFRGSGWSMCPAIRDSAEHCLQRWEKCGKLSILRTGMFL